MSSTLKSTLSELYVDHTQAEIGTILGLSQQKVSSLMRQLDITPRRQHTPAPKGKVAVTLTRRGRTTRQSARQLFINMYRRNTLRDIASAIGASRGAVHQFAISRRLSLRPRGVSPSSR